MQTRIAQGLIDREHGIGTAYSAYWTMPQPPYALRPGLGWNDVWMPHMKALVAATSALFMLMLGCVHAASNLSESQARAKAINILKGDPYGRTPAIVAKNIKQVQFVQDGNTKACGAKKSPAWEFHVVVVTTDKDQFNNGIIDGFLALDARTGKFLCANLPLLD